MRWVRLWLPLGIIALGIVLIAATGATPEAWEGGGAIIGAGLSVWLLNFFFRVGVQGDRERDAEDRARQYYDEHGHWPDEAPPPGPPDARPDPHPHSRRAGPAGHRPPRAPGPARRPPRRP
ncbi:MAG: hypothetical protein QOD81_215 [Solirubrobacteraceae bacterium]|jgi:hypothetical protein|nr:hypothetical protein [Solirubrobacteraceae bacterium]